MSTQQPPDLLVAPGRSASDFSNQPNRNQRITSIDLARGVVMVLMALDHVRDFVGSGTFYIDPVNLETTTPALFMTRWLTHFCAPVFVFLAGTSAFLYGRKKSRRQLARFLLLRGVWLVFLELTVINFAWTFDATLSLQFLQVIWAIGVSMIVLAAGVHLPLWLIGALGAVMVAGHNAFDWIQYEPGESGYVLWSLLHSQKLIPLYENWVLLVAYPVIPWIGVMALGYAFGTLFTEHYDAQRRRVLCCFAAGSVLLFLLLRSFNLYGDPAAWSVQDTPVFSLLSFINATKYPPSLLFLLMTLGPLSLFLALTENTRGLAAQTLITFGRVPLFYYITHLFLAHLMGIVSLLIAGIPWQEYVLSTQRFFSIRLRDHGYDLAEVYGCWLAVVLVLYPLCRWFEGVKQRHREAWWVGYV